MRKGFMSGLCAMAFVVIVVGCGSAPADEDETEATSSETALSPSCDAVKCVMPLCIEGQHLAYQGGCCPTCVGPDPRCADVMCPMLMCTIDSRLVTPKGQCCPKCMRVP